MLIEGTEKYKYSFEFLKTAFMVKYMVISRDKNN